jgi:hypothetical protein
LETNSSFLDVTNNLSFIFYLWLVSISKWTYFSFF